MTEVGRIAVPADVKVRFLRVSPDGRQLTAACGDGKLRVWPVPSENASGLLRTLDVDGEPISALAYSHDGAWVGASTRKGTVAVFDARTGDVAARFNTSGAGRAIRLDALAISADGSRVAVAPVNAPPELWTSPPRSGGPSWPRLSAGQTPSTSLHGTAPGERRRGHRRSACTTRRVSCAPPWTIFPWSPSPSPSRRTASRWSSAGADKG